jgi:hypothetical protein
MIGAQFAKIPRTPQLARSRSECRLGQLGVLTVRFSRVLDVFSSDTKGEAGNAVLASRRSTVPGEMRKETDSERHHNDIDIGRIGGLICAHNSCTSGAADNHPGNHAGNSRRPLCDVRQAWHQVQHN